MNKHGNRNATSRYSYLACLMTILGVVVIAKTIYIMTAKHDYWMEVANQKKPAGRIEKANRGNILSDHGELMASSLPEYKLFMDFKVCREQSDSLWHDKLDSICTGLSEIFPDKSALEFRSHLMTGSTMHAGAHLGHLPYAP